MATARRATKKRRRITELYYITHIANIPSILNKGILSHERIENEKIDYVHIYDEAIISRRKDIKAPDGRSLWSFANLYFNPRNPMLFRVIREKSANDIAILGIDIGILKRPDIYLTTGNAAHSQSEFRQASQKVISQIARDTDKEWWNDIDGSKREMMAECLVPDTVPSGYIKSIYVANYDTLYRIRETLPFTFSFIREPKMFFQPSSVHEITPRLFVMEGDMFFSRMQTLTISVNTVGVMGKGVASRAKYQFPDVYVHYQDLCRQGHLKMGKPALYKRESSLDYQLADEPLTLSNANSETWFLLFPTKRHWRDMADIHGIEEGLRWLRGSYKTSGIESLALPALGCGLGGLDWRDVGPLLCKYLHDLDIEVQIYLPVEREVPREFLSKDFLLSQVS